MSWLAHHDVIHHLSPSLCLTVSRHSSRPMLRSGCFGLPLTSGDTKNQVVMSRLPGGRVSAPFATASPAVSAVGSRRGILGSSRRPVLAHHHQRALLCRQKEKPAVMAPKAAFGFLSAPSG